MASTTIEAQLLGLVHDNAEATARVANELEQIDDRLKGVEGQLKEQTGLLSKLVTLQEARDAREKLIADAEVRRLDASAEGRKAEIDERKSRGVWIREQWGKVSTPLAAALGAVLLGLAGLANAWLAWFGGHYGPGAVK